MPLRSGDRFPTRAHSRWTAAPNSRARYSRSSRGESLLVVRDEGYGTREAIELLAVCLVLNPRRRGPPQDHQRQGQAGRWRAGRLGHGARLRQRPQGRLGRAAALRRPRHQQRCLDASRRLGANPVPHRPGPAPAPAAVPPPPAGRRPAAYATRIKAPEQEARAQLHAAQQGRKAALDPGRGDTALEVGDRALRCGPWSCSTPPRWAS